MGQFADLIDEAQTASPASASLATRLATQTPPDRAAEALQLARRYKLPPGVADTFVEDYKARAVIEDSAAIYERAPRLASWVQQHEVKAAVAQDDLETLGSIETTIRMLKNLPPSSAAAVHRLGAGLWSAAAAPFEVAAQGMDAAENAARDLIGLPRYTGPQPGAVIGEFFLKEARAAEAVAQRVGPEIAPNAGVFERGVYSGVQSATQTLLTIPVALLPGGQNAALGILSATPGGASFARERSART